MKKITVILKTWHFEMLPRYSFEYFLQRCRALGNQRFTQVKTIYILVIHEKSKTNS